MAIDVEEYYRKYGPMVLRRCRYLLRDEEAAVDALHETFVRVLRKKNRLDGRAPSSLLYTIATNTCLNILRSRKGEREIPWADDFFHGLEAEGWESRFLDRQFLEALFRHEQESTRTMALLHYLDGFTLEETAEQVGLSVSGVRKRLRKLRARSLKQQEVWQ